MESISEFSMAFCANLNSLMTILGLIDHLSQTIDMDTEKVFKFIANIIHLSAKKMYNSSIFFLMALFLYSCNSNKQLETEKTKLPNIVVILADDMGYGDVQAYNPESKIATPNINSLAEEGMKFTDAHTNSSVCTPTRYGLVTGRYAWRTRLKRGVLSGYSDHLIDTSRTTIASLLKQKGYYTAVIGKWHLGVDYQWVTGTAAEGFNNLNYFTEDKGID